MIRDEEFMRQALREAKKAAQEGEVPVGAVVVCGDRVVGRGHNRTIRANDPTAHAEIVALRKASRQSKNYRLEGCDLYATLEPCPMCLGAALQARIRKIVFGAFDPKAGAVQSLFRFPLEKATHRLKIESGVLAEESARILKGFFQNKRKKIHELKKERWPSG